MGFFQPVPEIGTCLSAINKGRAISGLPAILFHTDAAQAIGKIPVDVGRLSVDYLTIVGHKVCLVNHHSHGLLHLASR